VSKPEHGGVRSPAPRYAAPELRGFWGTVAGNARELLGWDLLWALLVASAGALWVSPRTLAHVLPALLSAEFGVIGALLGIVIAGLAVIVGFLSGDYAEVLMRSDGGPAGDFWLFWYVAAVAAASIVASGAGLVLAFQEPGWRREIFTATTFLAVYALLASVNLVAFVKAQGETRAYQLAVMDPRHRAGGPAG